MSENNVRSEFEDLRKDFSQMRGDLAGLTKAIAAMTAHGATDGLDDLKAAGKTVQREVLNAVDDADAACRSGLAAVKHQVSERPLIILAAAFGVGLLIGEVVHRR